VACGTIKQRRQPADVGEGIASAEARVRAIGLNYPPKVRRQMLRRLLSELGKQKRSGQT
jgi:hypothetical protein